MATLLICCMSRGSSCVLSCYLSCLVSCNSQACPTDHAALAYFALSVPYSKFIFDVFVVGLLEAEGKLVNVPYILDIDSHIDL